MAVRLDGLSAEGERVGLEDYLHRSAITGGVYVEDGDSGEKNLENHEVEDASRSYKKAMAVMDRIRWQEACDKEMWQEACDTEMWQEACDKEMWQEACDKEMRAHDTNGTFELVESPEGRKPIGTKWVFALKGKEVYEARLVDLGNYQKEEIDYQEAFSPVIRSVSLRMVLAIAMQQGLEFKQMGVSVLER